MDVKLQIMASKKHKLLIYSSDQLFSPAWLHTVYANQPFGPAQGYLGNACHFDLRLITLISTLINSNVQTISARKELNTGGEILTHTSLHHCTIHMHKLLKNHISLISYAGVTGRWALMHKTPDTHLLVRKSMKPGAAWRGSAYPGIINRRLFTNGSSREIWNGNEHYHTPSTVNYSNSTYA